MSLRCPDCCSEEAALVDRGTRLECGNCSALFHREQALVTVADAEAHGERAAACTCTDVRGCPQCFARADAMVGTTVRDDQGREWKVIEVDEKDGFPTVGGEDRWAYLRDVEAVG